MPAVRVVAMDLDTMGVHPRDDCIVEIAAVGITVVDPATGHYNAYETLYASLVDPERDIPPDASAVHHLTAEDVRGHGADPSGSHRGRTAMASMVISVGASQPAALSSTADNLSHDAVAPLSAIAGMH